MRSSEYIDRATAYIADPQQAVAVRRELQAHLEEAMAEAQARGSNPQAAEAEAVGRMGVPDAVAMDLAVAHHRHIPWRHYLALVPALALLFTFVMRRFPADRWRLGSWWWMLLVFCLLPTRASIERRLRLLAIDVTAKLLWLRGQNLTVALRFGAMAGGWAALVMGVLPLFDHSALFRTPFELLLPVLPGWVMLILLPRFHKGVVLLAAGVASLVFPLAFLPGLMLVWHGRPVDSPVMWLLFAALYLLSNLAVGWVARLVERKPWQGWVREN